MARRILRSNTAIPALVDWLSGAPHREAETYSTRWMEFSRHEVTAFAELRRKNLRWLARVEQLMTLHAALTDAYGEAGSWAASDDFSILDD